MARQRIIAVDVDGVLANLVDAWLWRYNQIYNDNVRPEDVKDWDITNYATQCTKDEFYDILRDGIYHYTNSFPGAHEEVAKLRSLGRVLFVTSCANGTMDDKHEWLVWHGFLPKSKYPPKDLVLAHDKALIRADVLLDDAIHNVESFPGPAFLVPGNHNAHVPCYRERLKGPGIIGAYERVKQLFESIE